MRVRRLTRGLTTRASGRNSHSRGDVCMCSTRVTHLTFPIAPAISKTHPAEPLYVRRPDLIGVRGAFQGEVGWGGFVVVAVAPRKHIRSNGGFGVQRFVFVQVHPWLGARDGRGVRGCPCDDHYRQPYNDTRTNERPPSRLRQRSHHLNPYDHVLPFPCQAGMLRKKGVKRTIERPRNNPHFQSSTKGHAELGDGAISVTMVCGSGMYVCTGRLVVCSPGHGINSRGNFLPLKACGAGIGEGRVIITRHTDLEHPTLIRFSSLRMCVRRLCVGCCNSPRRSIRHTTADPLRETMKCGRTTCSFFAACESNTKGPLEPRGIALCALRTHILSTVVQLHSDGTRYNFKHNNSHFGM